MYNKNTLNYFVINRISPLATLYIDYSFTFRRQKKRNFKKYLYNDLQVIWFKVKKRKMTKVVLDSK